jgi:small conductance mechanosensitive channel
MPLQLRLIALVLILGGVLLSALSGQAQPVNDSVQTVQAIEVGEDAITDAQIRDRIRQLLNGIGGYEGVTFTVTGGVVTLRGTLLDSTARKPLVSMINRVNGVVAIENETTLSTDIEERLAPALQRILQRAAAVWVNAPIYLIAFTVFFLIAWAGWKLTPRLPLWDWLAPNAFIADIYRAVARAAFLLFGVVVALDILNLTALLSAVLGAAGVVGLAVGFAVRDTVENFIASILLSLRQPFRPSEVVEINGDLGTVARLTSRATILISPDGNLIRIPNSTVYMGRIINYSRDPKRRFTFDLGVDADAELNGALATAAGAVETLPFVLGEPPVAAWVQEVGDSNVILSFAAWLDQHETDFQKGRGEAIRAAKVALERAGFGLPEPIYRLRVDSPLGKTVLTETVDAMDVEARPALRQPETAPEMHSAANPGVKDGTGKVVDRERQAVPGREDLLSPDNPVE